MEDFKSEYYTDLKETMEKYDIPPEAVEFAACLLYTSDAADEL